MWQRQGQSSMILHHTTNEKIIFIKSSERRVISCDSNQQAVNLLQVFETVSLSLFKKDINLAELYFV